VNPLTALVQIIRRGKSNEFFLDDEEVAQTEAAEISAQLAREDPSFVGLLVTHFDSREEAQEHLDSLKGDVSKK
jgi:aminoglycoside phosphotransferase